MTCPSQYSDQDCHTEAAKKDLSMNVSVLHANHLNNEMIKGMYLLR